VHWVVLGLHNLGVLQVMLNLLLICLSILSQLFQNSVLVLLHPRVNISLDTDVNELLQLRISEDLGGRNGLDENLRLKILGLQLERLNNWVNHLDLLLDLIGLVLDKAELDGLCLWVSDGHIHGRVLLLVQEVLLWRRLFGDYLLVHVDWSWMVKGLLVEHTVVH
jgi:hypothetical protein